MKPTITLEGKKYNLWFKHCNLQHAYQLGRQNKISQTKLSDQEEFVYTNYVTAFEAGQIKEHAWDGRLVQGAKHNVRSTIGNMFNGCTICYIEDENRNVVATGYSFCDYNDTFQRKEGRKWATKRAVREFFKKKYES